ncbi:MAG: oligosaccharide flippase family protein [Bacilli bacterium]
MKLISIREKFIKLKSEGFFSIFFSDVIAKIVAFMGGTILIHILTKEDYGTFTYILNAISILSIFGDFGAANATMQFASENYNNENRKNAYISLGLKISITTSLLSCALVFFSPYFYPFKSVEAADMTRILFMIPLIVSLNTFIIGVVRAALKNKRFALLNAFTAFIHYLVIIPFAYFGGLLAAVVSRYFFDGLTLIFGIVLSFSLFKFVKYKDYLTSNERKGFVKFSLATQLNTTIDSLLISADIFLIGLLVPDMTVIASYKTASIIPNAMIFLPSSLMIFLIPYFVRHNRDKIWMKKYTKILIGFCFVFFGSLTLITIIFAPLIIRLIFGTEYGDAVLCFRILMIGFFFSSAFKMPLNNIIFTMKKVKINILATVFSGIFNVLLDPILILKFGSAGAAITTCFVMIANSIVVIIYTYLTLYRNNKLIAKN